MNVRIDTLPEIIAAGLILLFAVLIVARAILTLARRGRIRIGSAEIGSESSSPPCAPYVAEHAAILKRLEDGQARIESAITRQGVVIEQIDAVQGPQIAAQRIVIKKIRAELGRDDEEMNGDLEEAWQEIREAELRHRELRKVGA